ncbi:MAG: PAS domain-containing protein [Pseudobacteriovorax sp.]|nr:PAS domain-containing protein [Pseudobacteriovorax sp.]
MSQEEREVLRSKVEHLERELAIFKLRERLYNLMTDHIPKFAAIIFDRNMRYVLAQGQALDDSGYNEAQMIGRTLDEVLPEASVEQLKPVYQKTLNGQTTSFEYFVRETYYDSNFVPILDENSNVTHGMIIIFDSTEIKKKLYLAEEASRIKSHFIATISHEIRTPINGIIGMADLVLEEETNATVHDKLKVISQCGTSLLDLINEVLDFSKIESQQISLLNESLAVETIMTDVSAFLDHKLKQKNLKLQIFYDDAVPRFVGIDLVKVKQILLNLVGNAVKFTEKVLSQSRLLWIGPKTVQLSSFRSLTLESAYPKTPCQNYSSRLLKWIPQLRESLVVQY